jgi:hypothetical protein
MMQSTVRSLLTRLTEQLVVYFLEDGQIKHQDEFVARLADGAWDGLILLLRQSIATEDEVMLEEIGVFRKNENRWEFHPAASLLEVDAMKLSEEDESKQLAQTSLFYLDQATELLGQLERDPVIHSESMSPESKLLRSVFGEKVSDESVLSDRITEAARKLERVANSLRNRGVTISVTSENRATLGDFVDVRPTEDLDMAAEERALPLGVRDSRTRRPSTVAEAIEAGKKAYREEKERRLRLEEGESIAQSQSDTANSET